MQINYHSLAKAVTMWSQLKEIAAQGLPFVCFRMPNSNLVKVYQQKDTALNILKDFDKEGFVFAPFDTTELPTIFLTKDATLSFEYKIEEPKRSNTTTDFLESDKTSYLNRIKKAVTAIKGGGYQKIVLSRSIQAQLNKDATTHYKSCLDSYTNAFCYLFYHPRVGTWLGATPERLCKLKGNTIKTASLAGTWVAENSSLPNWGQKELEEQQMVTDYIIAALKPFSKSVSVSKVQSVKAGNLWHLKTNIEGQLLTSQSLLQVVQDLHPTPAVCGIPKMDAKKYILQNEGYSRTYYTGYLGPVNSLHGETEIFVNLRCMQLSATDATIYVGGGITKDSIPENEWEETQAKSKTMGALLS
ncbi:isochorismate synthase [Flavobacterium sp. ASW18X]|nr:isochorismate synthase [Flavobacterium sp. ASW18X]